MGVQHYHRCDIAGLMLGMLLANSAPQAHPHQWIDVFTEWPVDTMGLISGVVVAVDPLTADYVDNLRRVGRAFVQALQP